uniref:Calmodulin n=1 Tax=Macrostomum lignano TaxID=282301 RepID=A0A1I8G524_9PLAT
EDELEKRVPSMLSDRKLMRALDGGTDESDAQQDEASTPNADPAVAAAAAAEAEDEAEELFLVSATELQVLQETFRMFDKDGDGCITTEELGTVLRCVGLSLSASQLKELLRRIDRDGNGTIEFDEFIQLIRSGRRDRTGAKKKERQPPRRRGSRESSSGSASGSRRVSPTRGVGGDDSEDELLAAFRVFDKDANGYISAAELKEVLSALGHAEVSLTDAQEMLREVDTNGDGLIDFPEFVSMLTSSPVSRVPTRMSEFTDSTSAAGDCDSTRACKADDD